MGRDYPDWGGNYNSNLFYPLNDTAELAVRLGSPIAFDRRGAVIWSDTFSNGLSGVHAVWFYGGSKVSISNEVRFFGAYSARLEAGADTTAYALIERYAPIYSSGLIGFSTMVYADADPQPYELELSIFDGLNRHYAALRYIQSPSELRVSDGAGGWRTLVSDWPTFVGYWYFPYFKMVASLDTFHLERIIINNHQYDVSDLAMESELDSTYPCVRLKVKAEGYDIFSNSIYVDNLILTANEPLNDSGI